MLYTLFILAVGIVIGWNLPQPPWAKDLQDRAVHSVRSVFDKIGRWRHPAGMPTRGDQRSVPLGSNRGTRGTAVAPIDHGRVCPALGGETE